MSNSIVKKNDLSDNDKQITIINIRKTNKKTMNNNKNNMATSYLTENDKMELIHDDEKIIRNDYRKINYQGNEYYVCLYTDDGKKLFVIDYEDIDKLSEINKLWYKMGNCIGCSKQKKKDNIIYYTRYYVHYLVMECLKDENNNVVDHINRNANDNRKINLRIVSKSSQKANQNKGARNLPTECDINPNEIPRYVWYDKNTKQFVIEIRKNNKRLIKKIGGQNLSIRAKLELTKVALIKLQTTHPYFFEDKNIFGNYSENIIRTMIEFNDIIKLSGFKCYTENKINIPKMIEYKINTKKLNNYEKKIVTNTSFVKRRRVTTELPDGCGVTLEMFPKFCYYQKAVGSRGDYFYVKNHPYLKKIKLSKVSTTTKKNSSSLSKFKEIKEILKELDNGTYIHK
jgi:hypothetical protein